MFFPLRKSIWHSTVGETIHGRGTASWLFCFCVSGHITICLLLHCNKKQKQQNLTPCPSTFFSAFTSCFKSHTLPENRQDSRGSKKTTTNKQTSTKPAQLKHLTSWPLCSCPASQDDFSCAIKAHPSQPWLSPIGHFKLELLTLAFHSATPCPLDSISRRSIYVVFLLVLPHFVIVNILICRNKPH